MNGVRVMVKCKRGKGLTRPLETHEVSTLERFFASFCSYRKKGKDVFAPLSLWKESGKEPLEDYVPEGGKTFLERFFLKNPFPTTKGTAALGSHEVQLQREL